MTRLLREFNRGWQEARISQATIVIPAITGALLAAGGLIAKALV